MAPLSRSKSPYPGNRFAPPENYIPIPSILVIVYVGIVGMMHIFFLCCIPFDFEDHPDSFWPASQYAGLSLSRLFALVNVLFIIYILCAGYAFATGLKKKHFYQWGSYAFALALLILLQVFFYRLGG